LIGHCALVRKGGKAAMIAVLALLPTGCSDSVKDDSPAGVIRQYLAALEAADFDGAMALRCTASQVDPTLKPLFLADVARIRTDAGGELRVQDLNELQPVRLVDHRNGAAYQHEFRLRLRVGHEASSPIHVGTVIEGGLPKVCGWSVEESFAVRDQLATETLAANPLHVDDFRDLVKKATAAMRGTVLDDASTKGSDGSGLEGWTAGWRTGSYGGGRLTIVRYDTPDSALTHANDIINGLAADSTSTFAVSSLPNGQALRYTGLAWTGVQPSDLGTQIDTAVTVYDDAVVWMTASGLEPGESHSKLTAFAEEVLALLNR
jgi:hypothetical protein